MDEERIDQNIDNKADEVMLPGFRFHPTDEELVGFYLRRKVQHKPLSIELIKQLDIYKYDPWDLPKLATTGEKEWYFYCPRDRKYRNSARPNRVTGAGFWKATGTDRPIYSGQAASKCIGLKKSLVFYKGRAAKGIKTDWMMHEFRLPSISDSTSPPKKYLDKNIPANEAWAICRIFKKANSSSQRAISHSWVSPVVDLVTSSSHDHHAILNPSSANFNFTSTCTTNNSNFYINHDHQSSNIASFSPLHFPLTYPTQNSPYQLFSSNNNNNGVQLINNTSYKTLEEGEDPKSCGVINDASSLLLDMSTSILGDFSTLNDEHCNDQFSGSGELEAVVGCHNNNYGLVPLSLCDAWKSNLVWDSSSPCPSDQLSTTNYYSTNNCYT